MIKKILYTLTTLLVILLAFQAIQYFRFAREQNHTIKTKGESTTELLKNQINTILTEIENEGNALAKRFGSEKLTTDEVEKIIKESSLKISALQGITACYEPFALDDNLRLYCPYYNKGSQDYLFVEKSYDYTDKTDASQWYRSVRDNGAMWVEPYFAQGAQDWYLDYGVPFTFADGPRKGQVRGTITMSFVVSGFKELVHNLSIGKTGYGIITSAKGTLLTHPINEYVGNKKVGDIIKEDTHPKLADAYRLMENKEKGYVEFYDDSHKDTKLFYHDVIPVTNWSIGLMFYKKDIISNSRTLNRKYINLALILSFLFICILAMYYNKDYLDEREIWKLSIVTSLLLLSILFFVGYLQHSTYTKDLNESPPIVDLTSLNSFVNTQNQRNISLKAPEFTTIPTGIYIERLEFQDSYNVNVGGRIWQKYPISVLDKVSTGFRFPEMSPFAEASSIEEVSRDTLIGLEGEADYLLINSEIRVTLRLNLKYADYPFDKQHLDFQISPLNASDYLVFTPDLTSYTLTNPSKKSGLDPKVEVSGSEILESYFNYSTQSYNTDFGYVNKGLYQEVPSLHFNISMSRKLLNSFVTYLIPIVVAMVMVFILLLAIGRTDERQGIIESMAAFFFVLIFSHIDLRKEIVTADLIYMEYFYFISYFMLILATFNMTIYSKNKSHIFDFNENQIFKAIFFPLILLLTLGITLYRFY